jgi:subtilisin family serine protease
MTPVRQLSLKAPWARPGALSSAPRQLLFKLTLGEAPESIPAQRDVRRGLAHAATTVDGGAVDRILRRFAGRVRVTRVHASAKASTSGGASPTHSRFDDLEQAVGLARWFRVQGEDDFSVADCVDALRQFNRVESACPAYLSALALDDAQDRSVVPADAWVTREQIGARAAMASEPGDPAVLIAVVDTGVAADHPELRGRLRPGFDTVELGNGELAAGLRLIGDETDNDDDPTDEVGHGTSCATIIGGRGGRIPPGLAGRCGMFAIRVLGAAQAAGRADPIGLGAIADIDHGMKWAVDLGARVINMSFGTPEAALEPEDPPPHADVIRYALARGCILIAASGNSGNVEAFSPASVDGVIAVGAVDARGEVTAFTTRGPQVALCAPGERVVTAGLHGYESATGTSFAAPFVTATAALMLSRALRRSRSLDGATTRRLLMESVRPHARGTGDGIGAGTLDVPAALAAVDRWIDRDTKRHSTPTNREFTQ